MTRTLRAALLACLSLAGCAQLHYDQLQLGMTPDRYDRLLPADTSRKTTAGLCRLTREEPGRTIAVVALCSDDRRIAVKLSATRIDRDLGLQRQTGFRLAGEIDPALFNASRASPFDAVRLALQMVRGVQGERLILDAHALVRAGLARFLQRWPHTTEDDAAADLDGDVGLLAPEGGVATLSVDSRGVYRLEYAVGTTQ